MKGFRLDGRIWKRLCWRLRAPAQRMEIWGGLLPKSDLIAGIVLLLFGLAMLAVVIPTQTSEGGDATISPALLPQICAAGITGLAALLTLQAAGRLRRGAAAGVRVPAAEWWAMGAVVLAVGAALALFVRVSPAAAAVLLVVGPMLYMGERRLWLLAGIPAALVAGAWFLFYRVLGTAIG